MNARGDHPQRSIVVFDLDETITRRDTTLPFALGYLAGRTRAWFTLPRALAQGVASFMRQGQKKNLILGLGLAGGQRAVIEAYAESYARDVVANGIAPGAIDKIAAHRRAGDVLVLASASVDLYVEKIGRLLGFQHVICTKVRWSADGRLSGKLDGSNCKGEEKLRRILEHFSREELTTRGVVYSDSLSDLPLLSLVPTGVLIAKLGQSVAGRPAADGLHVEVWQ